MQIERRAFHDALKQLAKVADTRATLPILSTVLLEARDGTCTLKATDLEQALQAQLPAEGEIHPCLPAKLLAALVQPEKKSDAGDVTLEILPDNMVAVTIDGMATKLHSLDPQDFPAGIASSEQNWSLAAMWPAKPLFESLSYVLLASSNDETRYNLCAVHLAGELLTATDGHRCHQAALPAPLAEPILVPVSAASTLKRILSGVEQVILAKSKDFLRIKAGGWQLDTKLTEGEFPQVDRVIPNRDSQKTRLPVDTKVFKKALARVSKLSAHTDIKMIVNGTIALSSCDIDLGEAETEVPTIRSSHKGKDLVIGFNGAFLQDALATKAESVELSFSDNLSPLRIDLEDNRRAVVMPLRV